MSVSSRAHLRLVRVPAAKFFAKLTRRNSPRIQSCVVAERLFQQYCGITSADFVSPEPPTNKRHPLPFDQWCHVLYTSRVPAPYRPAVQDVDAFVCDNGTHWVYYDADGPCHVAKPAG